MPNPTRDNTYENDGFRNSTVEYSNRDTILCEEKLNVSMTRATSDQNQSALERSHSMKNPTNQSENVDGNHSRTLSFVDRRQTATGSSTRKIPENLRLSDSNFETAEPSPALSSCSGPYIPISECFSGSPILLNNTTPTTPLNSLDPRFYDTPRSHINIGLNLTGEQPYSPKRNNCATVSNFNETI